MALYIMWRPQGQPVGTRSFRGSAKSTGFGRQREVLSAETGPDLTSGTACQNLAHLICDPLYTRSQRTIAANGEMYFRGCN